MIHPIQQATVKRRKHMKHMYKIYDTLSLESLKMGAKNVKH